MTFYSTGVLFCGEISPLFFFLALCGAPECSILSGKNAIEQETIVMTLVDLTRRKGRVNQNAEILASDVPLKSENTQYTGVIYSLKTSSMEGTYLDFPGHIRETDDGLRADNAPLKDFYRIPASVIHLNRKNGGVSAFELEEAFGGIPKTPWLIINAMGETDETELPLRQVWLDHSALDWILAAGIRCLISDVYESPSLHGVFLKLFQAGVSTVCCPANLHSVTAKEVLATCLFLPLENVTQIPCRLIAEY